VLHVSRGILPVPDKNFQVATIVSDLFAENAYIAHSPGRTDCVVVDPGLEPARIVDHLVRHGLTPAAILCTHGHSDHIAGNGQLKERWPQCELVIGAGDASKLTDAELNLSAPFGLPLISPPADRLVREGDRLSLAGMEFEVRETPGHSAGHVVFLVSGTVPLQVFVGDVLFQRGVGRTDFPDGDAHALVRSIHTQLFTLPDDTIVLPGHGEATTIGEEKRGNPFVGEGARSFD
jgi:hydroxyacylglutathione hydrolase